jgi:hypothetical protein
MAGDADIHVRRGCPVGSAVRIIARWNRMGTEGPGGLIRGCRLVGSSILRDVLSETAKGSGYPVVEKGT